MAAKRQTIKSEGKEMVAKVYHWLKYEAEHGVENVFASRWRTSQATGVSVHMISKLMGEEDDAMDTSTDNSEKTSKSKRKKATKCNLQDFDMGVLRRTIITFHADFSELPTLRKLKEVLSDRMAFDGSLETLRIILRVTGFEWSKTEDNRNTVREKHEIQMWRFKYLKQIKKHRDDGRYIVFTDEICVNMDNKNAKGNRVVVVNAGGSKGFIPNALLMFKAVSGEYHYDITHDTYKSWVTTLLLPNLPEKSVIVMGNHFYHNVLTEKPPNPLSKKTEIQAWLKEKKIPFEASLERIELYDLVMQNRDRFQSYVIEELCRKKGFEVIRLPPHHSELNPLERINGLVKESVGKKNSEPEERLQKALIKEKIEAIDVTTWANISRLVEQTEKQHMQYFDMEKESTICYDDSSYDDSDSNEMSE